MKNLRELALKATEENVVKRSKKENVLESMMRHLYEEKAEKSRTQLIADISLDRMIWEHGEDTVTEWATNDEDKFNKELEKFNKTVKNGIDTAVSNSKNNSAFSYNDKYKDYELIRFQKNGEEWIKIVDKDTKEEPKEAKGKSKK